MYDKVIRWARSPQGQRLIEEARRAASDPRTRDRLARAWRSRRTDAVDVRPSAVGQQRRMQIAMLKVLLATCVATLEALRGPVDHPLDADFVADLERVVARTRAVLAELGA